MKNSTILISLLGLLTLIYFAIGFSSRHVNTASEQAFVRPTPQKKSYIYGKVLYSDGRTASDAVVHTFRIEPAPDDSIREFNPVAISEKNGNYELEIEKSGTYDICATKQAENYLLANGYVYGILPGGKCETVIVGETERIHTDVTLGPQVNSLTGKITDWQVMYRLSEALVVVYRPLKLVDGEIKNKHQKFVLTTLEDADWDAKAEVKPNEKGEFVINGLPAGDYFLRLEFPDGETWFYKKGGDKEPTPITVKNGARNEIEFSFYAMSGRSGSSARKVKQE